MPKRPYTTLKRTLILQVEKYKNLNKNNYMLMNFPVPVGAPRTFTKIPFMV